MNFSLTKTIIITSLYICSNSIQQLTAQSEAGAPFLLIEPDAPGRAMGGAHSTAYNTPTAVYYNPASIAFITNLGVSVNNIPYWLPSLTDDISIQGFNFAIRVPGLGNIGGSYTNLNLGEQIRTGKYSPDTLSVFSTYMRSYSVSAGKLLAYSSSIGITIKRIEQSLAPFGSESSNSRAINYAADIGYQKLNLFPFLTPTFYVSFKSLDKLFRSEEENRKGLSLGISISNIGPDIKFSDIDQKDPLPQNLRVGFSWNLLNTNIVDIKIAHDRMKLLLKSYPDRDLNNDGLIIGDDEKAHKDAWYKAYITGWGKNSPPWLKKYGGEIQILGIIHLWAGIFQDPFIRDDDDRMLNLNSKGIGVGYEGFRISYTTLRTVKEHSVIDAIMDLSVFNNYVEGHPLDRTKAFTVSFLF